MNNFKVESVTGKADQNSGNAASALPQVKPADGCDIRVVGVGGCGGNAIQHMVNSSVENVRFIAVNTDAQALINSLADVRAQIGAKLTNGLGAGCNPQTGRKAAEESKEDLKQQLAGADMIFITAGMGGGTGTGAAPVVAELAKELGALTVAVVTKPFRFEGRRHMQNAELGITELSKHVDSMIVVDNEKLLHNLSENISIAQAFNAADDVLLNAVRGITDSITKPSYINLDFADVRTMMKDRGHAVIGAGHGKGENFIEDALRMAVHSPLIEQINIQSATGLLANVTVNTKFSMQRFSALCDEIQSYAGEEADCKFGMCYDDNLAEDEVLITIIITGIDNQNDTAAESPATVAGTNTQNREPAQGGFYNMSRRPAPRRDGFNDFNQNRNSGFNAEASGFDLGGSRLESAASITPASGRNEPQLRGFDNRSQNVPQPQGGFFSANRNENLRSDALQPSGFNPFGRQRQPDNNKGEEERKGPLYELPSILRNKSH